MNLFSAYARVLVITVAAVAVPIVLVLAVGIGASTGRTGYEVVKDLFVPLAGPLVAVCIPVVVLAVLPNLQARQRLGLELCVQYYQEEMRDARNTAWRHFVTEQRELPPIRRAERLNHFVDYLSRPEVHREVDSDLDAIYQKTQRVLDYFAIVDGTIARGAVDPELVRDFLFFYYLWWRDEIMEPLRRTQRMGPAITKPRPGWWAALRHLDALEHRRRHV